MADIAASVLTRLKNKAAESGRSYQLCLQLFCQEEFLRRLEKSRYAENLVLKGGLFLYYLTDFDSRVTVDVDFLLRQIPNTPEQLRSILEEIITVSTGKDVAPIAVAKKYAVIGASIVAHIKNTRTPFTIEQFEQVMSFGDDAAMQKKWKAFVRKINTKTDDYSTVLKTINAFLTKPFMAAVEDKRFTEQWYSNENKWNKEIQK